MILAVLVLQVATATPAPPPVLTGGFGKPAVAVQTAAKAPRRGTFTVAGPPARPVPAATPAATEASPEAVWRERVAALRSELAAAEAEEAALSAQITVVAGRPGRDYHLMMAVRNAALAPIRAKVMGLRQDLRALPEECRQTAGCQPGWIR